MRILKIKARRVYKLFNCITPKSFALSILFFTIIFQLSAQNNTEPGISLITISGVVRDAKTKNPVSLAQIRALNWEAAATTGDDGSFRIKVASPDEILAISAFDYGMREISLQGTDSIIVDLYPAVFTTQYKYVESTVGVVNNSFLNQGINSAADFSKSPTLTIDDEIQSQLGGNVRTLNRSGAVSLGSSLFIRGINSINAGTQPLFIVDGAVWDNSYDDVTSVHTGFFSNPLTTIDVADIESISVIKDGTSLYGSKAANGVIVIKTKRNKGLVTKITASGFKGIITKPETIPVMDAAQFRIFASDMLKIPAYDVNNNKSYFLNEDPSWPYYPKYHNSTNWQDHVYRTGSMQSYSLNINGGDERASYTFSVGYADSKGVTKNTDLQRINIRFNADINFTENFSLIWNIGYAGVSRNLLDDGVNPLTSPSFAAMTKAPFLRANQYTSSGQDMVDLEDNDVFGVSNPDAIIRNSLNNNKQSRFNIGITPIYKLSPSLTIKDNFSYNLYNISENFYRPQNGVDSVSFPAFNSVNEIRNQQLRNLNIFNDVQLIYDRKFNYAHHVHMTLGWRYYFSFDEWIYADGHNTATDDYRRLENVSEKFDDGFNNNTISVSNYANVDYSFKKRYILTAALDMDASSRFGKETEAGISFLGRKWGIFPSINGAWLVSSEQFMQPLNVVNLLKVRAGYGVTGNDKIGYYNTSSYFVSKKYMEQTIGLVIGNIANNQLQWETTYRANVGFDLSVLNERVFLSADVYKSKTTDLLMLKTYPDIAGLGNYWGNGGELSNTGYEVSANIKVLNLNVLKWELGMSLGHYKNKVEALPEGEFSTPVTAINGGEVRTIVGAPVSVFWGYKTKGVFATQADADLANLWMIDPNVIEDGGMVKFKAGDIYFDNYNSKDNIIDDKDRQVIGDPNPDFYGSVKSTLTHGNISCDILFTYSYGNDVYNYLRSQLESGAFKYNQSTAMLNRWRSEGQLTSQPKAVLGDPMGNARFSDRWIEDGSFLKLKTLSLSYKIPVKNSIVVGMNVWVAVNNVFTITNYLGRDPEFSLNNSVFYQGVDFGLMPDTKSFFVGLQLNL